jgi:hypothetical protein
VVKPRMLPVAYVLLVATSIIACSGQQGPSALPAAQNGRQGVPPPVLKRGRAHRLSGGSPYAISCGYNPGPYCYDFASGDTITLVAHVYTENGYFQHGGPPCPWDIPFQRATNPTPMPSPFVESVSPASWDTSECRFATTVNVTVSDVGTEGEGVNGVLLYSLDIASGGAPYNLPFTTVESYEFIPVSTHPPATPPPTPTPGVDIFDLNSKDCHQHDASRNCRPAAIASGRDVQPRLEY